MKLHLPISTLIGLAAVLAGCTTAPTPGAQRATATLSEARDTPHLGDGTQSRVPPGAGADLPAYIVFAVETHPRVAAAYQQWRASVASIAPARALPDPKLTFQADIADTLMSFMPGVMFDFMATGKRDAMAAEATAGSEVARRTFQAEVVRVAAGVRKAWVELAYANEAGQLHLATIDALQQARELADAGYATGSSMASLEQQVDLDTQVAEHHAMHASTMDRLAASRAGFKFSLGLLPSDPDPAWPASTLTPTALPDQEELWTRVLGSNTELAQMRAMVDMAVAGVAVAQKAATPDFSLGLMSDLKASPVMFRPTATLSLPIWRTKIADTITAAKARGEGARLSVDAATLDLAAELANSLYMVREADRMIDYFDHTALPNLERTADLAGATYQSGGGNPAMIAESTRAIQLARLGRLDALLKREQAVTDLLLMTSDAAPSELASLIATNQPNR